MDEVEVVRQPLHAAGAKGPGELVGHSLARDGHRRRRGLGVTRDGVGEREEPSLGSRVAVVADGPVVVSVGAG